MNFFGDMVKSGFGLLGQSGGSDAPAKARANEQQRQALINAGISNVIKSFAVPGQYNKRKQEYINFAMPRIGEKLRAGQKALIYNYADRGLLKSSAARGAQSAFDMQANEAKAEVVDQATEYADEAQAADLAKQNSLISSLIESKNPMLAQQQAMLGASQIVLPNAANYTSANMNAILQAMLAAQLANSGKK